MTKRERERIETLVDKYQQKSKQYQKMIDMFKERISENKKILKTTSDKERADYCKYTIEEFEKEVRCWTLAESISTQAEHDLMKLL